MVFKNLLLLSSSFSQNLQNHVYMVVCEYTRMPVCFMLSQSVFASFSLLSSLPSFITIVHWAPLYIVYLFIFCILPAKFSCKPHNILQESVIILIFLDRENIYCTG